jgi:hypothetical protein
MSLPVATMRVKSAPNAISPSFVRWRSTKATGISMVEAKSRVTEHARNISRSTTKNAVVAPAVYDLITSRVYFSTLITLIIHFSDDLHPRLDSSKYRHLIMLLCPLAQAHSLTHLWIIHL